jgi:hypothetical protein
MPLAQPEEIKVLPAYTIAEASRYIGMNRSTVREWMRGQKPIIHNSKGLISFMDLVCAHVLHTVRRAAHIPMRSVRRAAATLSNIAGGIHYLAHQSFFHDKSNLFILLEDQLISLSEGGLTGKS